jgi:hypothetical protein
MVLVLLYKCIATNTTIGSCYDEVKLFSFFKIFKVIIVS